MATQTIDERNAAILKMAGEVGVTQADIAERFGMTRSNVSQILTKLRKDDAPRRGPGRPRKQPPVNAGWNGSPRGADQIADELEDRANALENEVNESMRRIEQMRLAVKALRGE